MNIRTMMSPALLLFTVSSMVGCSGSSEPTSTNNASATTAPVALAGPGQGSVAPDTLVTLNAGLIDKHLSNVA
jgi:hypothetical protein